MKDERVETWRKSFFAASLALVLAFGVNSCRRHEMEMESIGPDVKADLILFFKADTTADQIYTFVQETIGNRTERGHESLPGMRQTLLVSVDGHQGYAIRFFPGATDAQRQFVRSRIDGSPLVFKVFENAAPHDIKTLK